MATSGDQQVPGWPLLDIRLTPDGGASVDGVAVVVPAGSEARGAALMRAAETAVRVGRPIRAQLIDLEGAEWLLAVHPDGSDTVLKAPATKNRKGRKGRKKPPAPAVAPSAVPHVMPQPAVAPPSTQPPPQPVAPALVQPVPRPAAPASPPPAQPAAPHVENPMTPLQQLLPVQQPAMAGQDALAIAIEQQDWSGALVLCEQRLGEASGDALDELREVQARLAALSGDAAGAYRHFRSLAQDRADRYGPDDAQAVTAADAAQEVWLASSAGDPADLLALRSRVPGLGGAGLARARMQILRSRIR